jgi:hypothetical protein
LVALLFGSTTRSGWVILRVVSTGSPAGDLRFAAAVDFACFGFDPSTWVTGSRVIACGSLSVRSPWNTG